MSATDVGRTVFSDGMRVSAEHLDHLQAVALEGGFGAREAAGVGKVCFGLRVEAKGPTAVTVNPGLAFDQQGRSLPLDAPVDVTPNFGSGARVFLVAVHSLRATGIDHGVPTLISDDTTIEVRTAAPPYQDDGVVFAQLDSNGGAGIGVTQLGDWFLPALDHGHSGVFILRAGRWRYDGHPVGPASPAFDSGFVAVAPGATVSVVHGQHSTDLVVQLQSRRSDGVVTVAGLGQAYWYEIADDQHIRLVRSAGTDALDLRVCVWPMRAPGAGPALPVADAGSIQVVETGQTFTLDGSQSRPTGGRQIAKYVWTELT